MKTNDNNGLNYQSFFIKADFNIWYNIATFMKRRLLTEVRYFCDLIDADIVLHNVWIGY